ncbi:hypothetical protein [Angelakisella massiliensis]|uniref:hypothetical protein n=1 Tax=Angelakisella massiliensis TaxID=1871018 RepID=UPI0024B10A12|nr:hypothetical protein [Angelakisella massiliensis]
MAAVKSGEKQTAPFKIHLHDLYRQSKFPISAAFLHLAPCFCRLKEKELRCPTVSKLLQRYPVIFKDAGISF